MTLYLILLIYDELLHFPLYYIAIARIISTITSDITPLCVVMLVPGLSVLEISCVLVEEKVKVKVDIV